jgi:hypothetical protein
MRISWSILHRIADLLTLRSCVYLRGIEHSLLGEEHLTNIVEIILGVRTLLTPPTVDTVEALLLVL